jgi:GNAT superfamily N-acetyltransferase
VPNLDGWVYVHEGTAVAGAWSYLNGADCGLYAIGTVPDFRRRGMAAALIQHMLAHASRRGARTASLQSTRMGESLYRSLQFTAVGRYEEWVPA